MNPSSAPLHDTRMSTLSNGLRLLHLSAPGRATASVSVFVRSGSMHEMAAQNGISHVLEHMVFKGTAERDARRINLDAEHLGAQVDAHTDKDHTAFHLQGLQQHVPDFIDLLGDLVCRATFPADELERERQVLLHELAEVEDDPVTLAFSLFDQACYGRHPWARPVIGARRNVERLSREDLLAFTRAQYTGSNVLVAVLGAVDEAAVMAATQAAFGELPAGSVNLATAPAYQGGLRVKAQAGSGQSHVVLGFPAPGRVDEDPAMLVAATLFGEGMSSPLLHELREQRGLVYHAGCSVDLTECCGQFVVEATTSPGQLDELLVAVTELLLRQAAQVDASDMRRARHQIAVRHLLARDRALSRIEADALDVFALGAPRASRDWAERIEAVTPEEVRQTFERMFAAGPSLAVAGQVQRGAAERARRALVQVGGRPA